MTIIYTNQRSKKTRKQKAREEAEWLAQCQRDGLLPTGKKFEPMTSAPKQFVRDGALDFQSKGSLKTDAYDTYKPADKVYTGTACIGIAVQHKSCLQPIFSEEAAKDSAKMRR